MIVTLITVGNALNTVQSGFVAHKLQVLHSARFSGDAKTAVWCDHDKSSRRENSNSPGPTLVRSNNIAKLPAPN